MIKTDLAIIGSGPGGYITAIRAAKKGLDTTVIEKDKLGGVCLNWGCMPTKALYHLAQELGNIKKAADLGIKVEGFSLDYAHAVKNKDKMVGTLRRSIAHHFKQHHIRLIESTAKFNAKGRIEAGQEEIDAKYTIVATGSSPASVQPFDISQEDILTNRDILSLDQVPESLAIIGGGIVGVEFANIMAQLGCRVTIIEMLPQILSNQDNEISKLVSKLYTERGIDIYTSTTVSKLTRKGPGLELETDKGHTIKVEKVLLSVGRKPNTDGIGLKEAQIKTDSKGFIKVDDYLLTSVDNVYAIGDVIGGLQLAHAASAEGKNVVDNIMGIRKKMNYDAVPYVIFTSPQIAAMGLTEQQAKENEKEIGRGKFPFSHNGRALIDNQTQGFVKVISDSATGELLGAHIIGPQAGELIHVFALAKSSELLVDNIVATIYAHPTLSESILEAGEDVFGLATHI